MSHKIAVQPLTDEAFAKYGSLVRMQPGTTPLADNPDLTYWEKVVEFEPGIARTIGLLREKRRDMLLTKMERHTKAKEWFVPIDGECVACFADFQNPDDPAEVPEVSKVVAFKMEGIVGFVVDRGGMALAGFPDHRDRHAAGQSASGHGAR